MLRPKLCPPKVHLSPPLRALPRAALAVWLRPLLASALSHGCECVSPPRLAFLTAVHISPLESSLSPQERVGQQNLQTTLSTDKNHSQTLK